MNATETALKLSRLCIEANTLLRVLADVAGDVAENESEPTLLEDAAPFAYELKTKAEQMIRLLDPM